MDYSKVLRVLVKKFVRKVLHIEKQEYKNLKKVTNLLKNIKEEEFLKYRKEVQKKLEKFLGNLKIEISDERDTLNLPVEKLFPYKHKIDVNWSIQNKKIPSWANTLALLVSSFKKLFQKKEEYVDLLKKNLVDNKNLSYNTMQVMKLWLNLLLEASTIYFSVIKKLKNEDFNSYEEFCKDVMSPLEDETKVLDNKENILRKKYTN